MPEYSTQVAHDLVKYFTDILQPLFDEKRAVVWYDREGALEEPLRAAAAVDGWKMIPGSGAKSPLAARVEIEEQIQADGFQWLAERKWLVYVPGERRDASWYEDLELAGRTLQKTLAEVIAERHDLPVPKVAALVKSGAAQRLVKHWDRAFPNGTWILDLEKLGAALLALAFGESGALAPRTAVLRFLRDPVHLAGTLQDEGLIGTFVHVVRTQLGFGRLPEIDEVKPALLVRAMMASELIHKGACETSPAINNYLPQKNHMSAWSAMAEEAVKDPECRPIFLQLAREVEAEVNLVHHATNLGALTKVVSVPSIDARLLEEAVTRVRADGQPDAWAEIRDWADDRLKLVSLGLEVAADWSVVAAATRLLLGCKSAEEELASLSLPSPEAIIQRYADRTRGWWRFDSLHRGMELRFDICRPDVVECLGKPAVAAF